MTDEPIIPELRLIDCHSVHRLIVGEKLKRGHANAELPTDYEKLPQCP